MSIPLDILNVQLPRSSCLDVAAGEARSSPADFFGSMAYLYQKDNFDNITKNYY